MPDDDVSHVPAAVINLAAFVARRITSVFISNIQNLHGSSVSCFIELKIDCPHMIRILTPNYNWLTSNFERALAAANLAA